MKRNPGIQYPLLVSGKKIGYVHYDIKENSYVVNFTTYDGVTLFGNSVIELMRNYDPEIEKMRLIPGDLIDLSLGTIYTRTTADSRYTIPSVCVV